jgi:CRP-like cAMP-binding protein
LNRKPKKLKKNGKADSFDPQVFLDTAGVARKVADFRRGESIYSQDEAADRVMYVQRGGVKFSVVNGSGKEAVVAMFGPSDFFGEGCMAGQSIRMGTSMDANTIESTLKKAGQVLTTVTSTVSKDGKTRTSTFKGKDAQGHVVNNVVVYDKP